VTCTTALLRGEQVTSTTGSWSLDGAAIAPLPTQAQLPIWLSGHAPAAIDRAARLADGWIGSGFSPLAAFATDVERFRLACDAAGRQRSDVTVAKRVYLHVPDACPSGRRDLDPWSRSLFGAAGLGAEVVVQGTPAECAEAIDAVIAAGADHVIVDPAYHDHSHVEAILTDVLPRTRGGTL
jgi:alkanesulfonate monooxygenase SsuD/methylene tetrahydromethanopterin reductase-like flavin-dependent oxidoreductase (luciferase family)